MSIVDLATLTMHRRMELECRINLFTEKCNHAINDIRKLNARAQGFTLQLNCEPEELKDRFLNAMKQLDEYMYLITDFNLVLGKIEDTGSTESTPVHDTQIMTPLPAPVHRELNLIDTLSEPTPSTSAACFYHCPPAKPKRTKVPREDQLLIAFSSASSSSESVPQVKSAMVTKEVQCEMVAEMGAIKLDASESIEPCNLPAQTVLETDHAYTATIMHIDGIYFWLITDNGQEVINIISEMTEYYSHNHAVLGLEDVKTLTCCAFYDAESECYYRGLFLKLLEENMNMAEVFAVDTGEIRTTPVESMQPLAERFCVRPPFARCCHLAGVDLSTYNNKTLMEKQEEFLRRYVGNVCTIEVDDNTSESLGVYVILPTGEILNNIFVQQGLGLAIDNASAVKNETTNERKNGVDNSELDNLDITECPEYDDPVLAVTGYHNKDEAEICKFYKGGPEKTCFKGSRCVKRHVNKHPDGWTLDRVEVVGKLHQLPLPAPRSWLKVLVTAVAHYDRFYVQIQKDTEKEELPDFGVVMPPTTLESLARDMNSPATRLAYKPLTITPAPGEYVAALYPLDNNWYRACVLSITRADQNVEVMYVDYGTVLWVKEDQIRELNSRFVTLPVQAILCVLAGVTAKSQCSKQWAGAKKRLSSLVQDKILDAHVVARDYDELVVELFDDDFSIAEHLAALGEVHLKEYSIEDDKNVTQKIVVP